MKAVIFDLYGTLLELTRNSQPYRELACQVDSSRYRSLVELAMTTDNQTLADFVTRAGLPLQGNLPAMEEALRREISSVRTYVEVIPTLALLQQRGVAMAVISNLASPYKRPFFESGLDEYIPVRIFSCDCGLLKPDPAIYRLALERLGTLPDETIMVGDSLKSDVQGPSEVGIRAVHLIRSHATSPASTIIRSLEAILQPTLWPM